MKIMFCTSGLSSWKADKNIDGLLQSLDNEHWTIFGTAGPFTI